MSFKERLQKIVKSPLAQSTAAIGAGTYFGKKIYDGSRHATGVEQTPKIELNGSDRWQPLSGKDTEFNKHAAENVNKINQGPEVTIPDTNLELMQKMGMGKDTMPNLKIDPSEIDKLTAPVQNPYDVIDDSTYLKIASLEENFIKTLDRNVFRPQQYSDYKDALMQANSQSKLLGNQVKEKLDMLRTYKNSADAPMMSRDLDKTKEAYTASAEQLQHLQNHGLAALKNTPREMEVKDANRRGLSTGLTVGGAIGGIGGMMSAGAMQENTLQEGLDRKLGNLAFGIGMTGLGAVAGHAGQDYVQDAVQDGASAAVDHVNDNIDAKLTQGQQLTPDEQKNYDNRHSTGIDLLDAAASATDQKIGTELIGHNIAKYSPVAGALLGAGFANRMKRRSV